MNKMSNRPKHYLIHHLNKPFDTIISVYAFRQHICQWDFQNIAFPFWILYWTRSRNAAELIIGNQSHFLDPDEVTLIPPHTLFSTRQHTEFEQFYVHFLLPEYFDRVKRELLFMKADCMKSLFPQITRWQDHFKAQVYLRILIYTYLMRIPDEAFLPEGESAIDPRIRNAIQIMTQNLRMESIPLARKVNMSRANFYRIFLKETEITPNQYLQSLRYSQAVKLLTATDLTIDEIAQQTGFKDRYHFSKVFKKHCGMPPAAYKKNFKGIQDRYRWGEGWKRFREQEKLKEKTPSAVKILSENSVF